MASRNSTRNGASANTRRTAGTKRSRRGSLAPAKKTAGRKRGKAAGGRSSHRRPAWLRPVLLVTTLVLATWLFYPALKIHYQENRERARLEVELESLKERNETLSAQVERLKTPEGVEEVARESLGMVKPGENLYVVLGPESDTTATVASEIEESASDGVWTDLLDLVFGVR